MNALTRRFTAAVLVALLALAAGCATVQMASPEDDARGKTFAVRAGKANLYVYRNETFGAAIPMTVSLDGRVAGQSAAQTYFLFEVDPGTHEVASHAEDASTLKVTAEAGKSVYVWQEVKMGFWMARSLLQQVDEETGRKGVAECTRAKSNF